jgi:serpin B
MRHIVCLWIVCLLGASGALARAGKPSATSVGDLTPIVSAGTQLGLDLYRKLRRPGENLFLSPPSVFAGLSMAYAGARGTTAQEMARVLHLRGLAPAEVHRAQGRLLAWLSSLARGGIQLDVANALWAQKRQPFLREFAELLKTTYGAGLDHLDFVGAPEQARATINGWVSKKTRGKIAELIPAGAFNEWTRLVLTNAVYFKSSWAIQFPKTATRDLPFTLTSGKKLKVPLMNLTDSFRYGAIPDLQILELPYKGGTLAMVILLPRRVDGLPAVEQQLSSVWLARQLRRLPRRKVEVYLPRFKVTRVVPLAPVLRALGLKEALLQDGADFSGIDGRRGLFIAEIFHRAWVEVNEEGTEAAAATAIMGEAPEGESPQSPPVFRADHPFLFLIRDRATGCVLFLGRIENPRA